MLISQNGLDLIKKYEGLELHTYDDGVGNLTIGYGHTQGVEWGQVVTKEQAEEILKKDLMYYCNDVQTLIDNGTIKFSVNQNMFDSLVSFCFNLGKGNLIQLVTNRNEIQVAESITKYVWAGGKILQGLVYRRQAEKELFMKPIENVNTSILELQKELNLQFNANLVLDGIVGVKTLSACPTLRLGSKGNITKWVQKRLTLVNDGIFGEQTLQGVINFQKSNGLQCDGIIGTQTWRKLLGL